jgi:hypothetical protein
MSFEQNIQNWVSIDNQIKLLSDKIQQLREKKHELSENIENNPEIYFFEQKNTKHVVICFVRS